MGPRAEDRAVRPVAVCGRIHFSAGYYCAAAPCELWSCRERTELGAELFHAGGAGGSTTCIGCTNVGGLVVDATRRGVADKAAKGPDKAQEEAGVEACWRCGSCNAGFAEATEVL